MFYNYDTENEIEEMEQEIEEALSYLPEEEQKETIKDWGKILELAQENDITGNMTGSKTCNRNRAREKMSNMLEIAIEAYREFGMAEQLGEDLIKDAWERIHVITLEYLLPEAVSRVQEKLQDNLEEEQA